MLSILTLIVFALTTYLFILFIVKRDKGSKEPLSALFAASGFGLLALIIAGTISEFIIPSATSQAIQNNETHTLLTQDILIASVLIGAIEELAKCIPLAIFIFKKKYFNELTDGIIYFGLAALTFGLIEDILYFAEFGAGTGLLRGLLGPYLHVGFTVLFGVCLIRYKLLSKKIILPITGLVLAILAHAIYDFAVFIGSTAGFLAAILLSLSLNVSVFILFAVSQRKDEELGLSSKGINKFCRRCGTENRKRYLYCTFCGQLT